MRVIGFDPGLRRTGWGVVDGGTGAARHVAHGVCTTVSGGAGDDLAARLASLHAQIDAVIARRRPTRRRSSTLSSTRIRSRR